MDLQFLRAPGDEVAAEWTVAAQHLQGYGIVHGGVHCGVIETLASVGAALHAMSSGKAVVGLENHTSFIPAVRQGEHLTATARPLTRRRSSQVWEASVLRDDRKLVATGRVRLLYLAQGSPLAGRA